MKTFEPRDRSRIVFCNNEHIAIEWTNPGVCPLCASHEEIDRLRTAAEKLHAFVNAKGQEHEESALGRINTQSKTYDEERALVCWQVLDEIEALFQGAGEKTDMTAERDIDSEREHAAWAAKYVREHFGKQVQVSVRVLAETLEALAEQCDDPEAALNAEELAALRLRELTEGEAAAQEQSGGAFVAGDRVWYEPHDGVRFAGVVTGPGTLEGARAVLLVGTYWLWRAMDRSVHFTHREAFAVREGCLLRRDGPSIGVDGAYEREKMSRESEGEER